MGYRLNDNFFYDLCLLAARGDLYEIKKRLGHIPKEDSRNFDGQTFVSSLNDVSVIAALKSSERECLISSGVFSPLHDAAFCGHFEVVEFFLTEFPQIDVNALASITDDTKRAYRSFGFHPACMTLVMAACCNNNSNSTIKILDLLVRNGADLHKPTRVWGPPLTVAAYWGNLDTVTYLIDNGASVNNSFDRRGMSPLLLACASPQVSINVVRYLLDSGADVQSTCIEGYTAMHCAALHDKLGVIKLLIERGLSPTFTPGTSEPTDLSYVPCPLYLASAAGHVYIREFLSALPECPPLCKGESHLIASLLPGYVQSPSSAIQSFDHDDENSKQLWMKGLELIENSPIKPNYPILIDAYLFEKEISARNELENMLEKNIYFDSTDFSVRFQGLMVAERCLGLSIGSQTTPNMNLFYWLALLGFQAVRKNLFHLAEKIWKHACEAFVGRSNIFLSHPQYRGKEWLQLPGSSLLHVLLSGVRTLVDRNYDGIDFPFYTKFSMQCLEMLKTLQTLSEEEENIRVVFNVKYFVGFYLLWLQSISNSSDDTIPTEFLTLGQELFDKFLYQPLGSSLIHQIVLRSVNIMDQDFDIVVFSKAIKYFVLWGEKALTYFDFQGNQPLHLAMKLPNDHSIIKNTVIMTLINCGAHVDAVNRAGISFYNSQTCDPKLKMELLSNAPLPLTCYAARKIALDWDVFQDALYILPVHIVSFIKLHVAK